MSLRYRERERERLREGDDGRDRGDDACSLKNSTVGWGEKSGDVSTIYVWRREKTYGKP